MRVAAALLVLVLLGIAGFVAKRLSEESKEAQRSATQQPDASPGPDADPDPDPDSDAVPPQPLPFEWSTKRQRCGELVFTLPKSWEGTRFEHNPGYLSYSGPSDDDFMPQLQILWRKSNRTLEGWSDWMGGKARNDTFAKVLAEGKSAVAGAPAIYLVYQRESRRSAQEPMRPFTTIDFYFVRDGHEGMVRGVATGRTFRRYRPLFEEIARRLRYAPADSDSGSDSR